MQASIKRKIIKFVKTVCLSLLLHILVYKAEKSNVIIDFPLFSLFHFVILIFTASLFKTIQHLSPPDE